VLSKHRNIILRRRAKSLGMIGLPYFLFFPWVDVIVSLLLITTIVRVFVTRDDWDLLFIYFIMCGVQFSLTFYAVVMSKENRKLSVLALIDSFFYYHLISFTILRAGINYLRKKETSWNKLKRYGKNTMPINSAPEEEVLIAE
jgi:hypothetical protein